mgnify:CR=1 FL=1
MTSYDEDLDDYMERVVTAKAINAKGISYGYFVDQEGNIISPIALLLEEEEE